MIEKILKLKKERNAIILAHNYQLGEVQDIADFNGDSLQLARKCTEVDADVIVFCGVHFMAETAAILNPHKTVLLPDPGAGCPMADMADAEGIRKMKAQHPGAKVVCYVNSTAGVKAESDLCCTSSNAMAVVGSIPADIPVIFAPDQNLGSFVAEKLNRDNIILWPGYCPVHQRMTETQIAAARAEYPAAKLVCHPECPKHIRDLADAVLSTGQMCTYAQESDAQEFIIATEIGMLHRLQKDNPGKKFYAISEKARCCDMKLITLEKVLWALEEMQHVITVEPEIAVKALKSIEGMLALTES
jgi:quinolinate synthase